MKKLIYTLILPLLVLGGQVFADRDIKNETSKKPSPGILSAAKMKTERETWEATPEGIKYKQWEASPGGQKVFAGTAKIKKEISAFANMEAVVTSLSLPPGSRLGFGLMVRINDEDFILSFGLENADEFQQLHSLKVNDKIILKSHSVSHAPKYSYPIISGEYVERDNQILYKRSPRKGGC